MALKKTKKTTKTAIKKPVMKTAKTTTMPVTDMKKEEQKPVMPPRKKLKNLWLVIVFLILLGAFLYYAKSLFIVALVNGRPITSFSFIKQLEKTNGKTALDSLVNQQLIEQEAKKQNIVVTDAEVQAEMDKVKNDLKAQGMTLDSALSSQGMTVADFQENLKMKQTVEKLLKDQIKVSDDDVKKYFEDNKSSFGKDAKFEDLQGSIKDQLENEKLSTAFQEWYTKLKNQSDIKYFVNFQ